MSSQVTLVATKFVCNGQNDTYGYRIYDDYGKDYCNLMSKDEHAKLEVDDMGLLEYLLNDLTDVSGAIIEYIQEHETGMFINSTFYSYDELGDLQ